MCNTWHMLASLTTESRLLKTKVERAGGETVGKGELSAALGGLGCRPDECSRPLPALVH